MKKIYFYGMLAAGLLASCSNDAPATSDVNNESELARVPITLGASSNGIVQREVVNDISGKTIGVFAMAKDIDVWRPLLDGENCILDNVFGTVGIDNAITWPSSIIYYPVMSNHNYSFFGYYPTTARSYSIMNTYHGPANVEEVITVTYTDLDGTQDLICGSAIVTPGEDGKDGYNAAYIRANPTNTPKIELKHRLIQLIITVNGANNNENGDNFKIDKVELLNAPQSLDMVVATHGKEGEIVKIGDIMVEEAVHDIGTYTLTPAEETPITLVHKSEGATELGKVMLPAWSLREGKFKAAITISTTDGAPIHGESSSYSKEFEITAPAENPFTVGNAYTINLTISDPETIQATATLDAWNTIDTPSDITIE